MNIALTLTFMAGGKTIEAALGINMNRFGGSGEMGADRRSQLSFLYSDIALILIDEASMLGTNKLAAINHR